MRPLLWLALSPSRSGPPVPAGLTAITIRPLLVLVSHEQDRRPEALTLRGPQVKARTHVSVAQGGGALYTEQSPAFGHVSGTVVNASGYQEASNGPDRSGTHVHCGIGGQRVGPGIPHRRLASPAGPGDAAPPATARAEYATGCGVERQHCGRGGQRRGAGP